MAREFLFSGTLGDAYVALCKLYKTARSLPCTLRRICTTTGSDPVIANIAALFSGVEFRQDYLHFDSIDTMRKFAFENCSNYLNIFWDGDGRGNEPDDPQEIEFTAYPVLTTRWARPVRRRPLVGLQIKCGSRSDSQRWLDPAWVVSFSRLLDEAGLDVEILGSGTGFTDEELNALKSIRNCPQWTFGQSTFPDWLSRLATADYLITPDGFSAFFAQSQRVPALVAYSEKEALLRMAQPWRDSSICVRPYQSEKVAGGERWVPLPAAQTASLVLARLKPDCG